MVVRIMRVSVSGVGLTVPQIVAIEDRSDERKSTLATSVYERLRTDLLSGRLEPNSKLRVEWVAANYGAGTSPVREALNRLAAEGLLTRHDQRGFSVVSVSLEDLEELTRTRCWVEEIALRESIAHRTPAWEEDIVLALHWLGRAPPKMPGELHVANPEWERRHRGLHRALISGCRSRWIIGLCDNLADQAYRYRQIARRGIGEARDALGEHRTIAELAIAGRADEAVAALLAHYRETTEICRIGLQDLSPASEMPKKILRRVAE
jgi:DNA-binding GntR family transcriptional regulator